MSITAIRPDVSPRAGSLTAARGRLREAVAEFVETVAGDGLGWAPDVEVAETLIELQGITRQLDAVTGDVAARVAGGNVFAEAGFRTAAAWVQARSNESRAGARRVFEHGEWLECVPVMGQAWREGSVSLGHVRALVEAHQRFPRLSTGLTQIESELTNAAKDLDPKTFSRVLLTKLHEIDPQAMDDAESKRRRKDIGLHVSATIDGFVAVNGLLTPEVGQQLISALASASDALRRKNAEEAGKEELDTPSEIEQPLSRRNIDALGFILDAAASATGDCRLPDVGGVRPVVQVTIDSESLIAHGASAPGWILSLTGQQVTPVSATTARRLACDSIRQILLLDPRGHLDAISALERVIPLPMRKAISIRDRGTCRFPGCAHAIREIHHITYWQHGGTTTTDNLVGLCAHHHHHIHDKGWTLTGNPNARLTFTDPMKGDWHSDPPPRE